MVKVKAYRGSEIRRFDIEAGATFAQLQELIVRLFGLRKEDAVTINYCDMDGDVVRLSSDAELQAAFKHLGEQDTWKLQILVQRKQEVDHRPPTQDDLTSWWDWNPFHVHIATRAPSLRGLFADSFWNDDEFFGVGLLPSLQHRLRLAEETKKAEMARRNAMRQASVDAKRASDEVQAQASGGEVAEKKPKVTYRHFGSWEPKVEKGDNYVVTTYGPVGYEVHYTHGGEEAASGETAQGENKEQSKMES